MHAGTGWLTYWIVKGVYPTRMSVSLFWLFSVRYFLIVADRVDIAARSLVWRPN